MDACDWYELPRSTVVPSDVPEYALGLPVLLAYNDEMDTVVATDGLRSSCAGPSA